MKKAVDVRGLVLAVLVTVTAVSLYTIYPRFLEELEDRALDLRFWIRGARDPGADIAIVAASMTSTAPPTGT